MNKEEQDLITKAQNINSLRVLYKKPGQIAEVKIIQNIQKLKKAIIKHDLQIMKYGDLYLVCNSNKAMRNMEPNIALFFSHISGDLILLNIDKDNQEFKSLELDDITWYTSDLSNKSFNHMKNINTHNYPAQMDFKNNFGNREIGYSTSKFENSLIQVLVNIELVLANLLKVKEDKK